MNKIALQKLKFLAARWYFWKYMKKLCSDKKRIEFRQGAVQGGWNTSAP